MTPKADQRQKYSTVARGAESDRVTNEESLQALTVKH